MEADLVLPSTGEQESERLSFITLSHRSRIPNGGEGHSALGALTRVG